MTVSLLAGTGRPESVVAPALDAERAVVVRLDRLTRRFGASVALDDVSLSIRRGEIVGIIGRSGAGKSTLIRCVNGLERPDSGSVEIEGRDITRLGEPALQPVRRRIGMIFQHFNLLSSKSVADNVALPLKIGGVPRAARLKRVAELLDLTGLSAKADAYPAQLSGGQKQRVGIARALAADPAVLLSDEATSALDPETTQSILALLGDINRRLGLTILLITHEMSVIRAIADRVAVLDHGRIVEEGPVWQLFAAPQSPTTISLLSSLRPELPATFGLSPSPIDATEAVIRVELHGEQAERPLIAELAIDGGIVARLIHGGIEEVRGRPLGTLFLGVAARGAGDVEIALEFLRRGATHAEVIGYVRGPV